MAFPTMRRDATSSEPPPLWGVRFRKFYLLDGRATALEDAVRAHGGEAADAAQAYENAGTDERAALLRFLGTL